MAESLGLASTITSLMFVGQDIIKKIDSANVIPRTTSPQIQALKAEILSLILVLTQLVEILRSRPTALSSVGMEEITQILKNLDEMSVLQSKLANALASRNRDIEAFRWRSQREYVENFTARLKATTSSLVLILRVLQMSHLSANLKPVTSPSSLHATAMTSGATPPSRSASIISHITLPSVQSQFNESWRPANASRYTRYLDRLSFGTGDKYHLKVSYRDSSASSMVPISFREIEDGIVEHLFTINEDEIQIIVCGTKGATTNQRENMLIQQSPNHIPFSMENFMQLMHAYKLSSSFFKSVFAGVSTVALERIGEDSAMRSLLLRTPLSSRENWTLAVVWNLKSHAINCIIHGVEQKDLDTFTSSLEFAREHLVNPLLLPLSLCEMLVDSDSQAIRTHAGELYEVEFRTNFHGFYTSGPVESGGVTRSPEQDFEEITRSLNFVISRLAFHQMRISANVTLIDGLVQVKQKDLVDDDEEESWKARSESSASWVESRLASLKAENQALLLEIACNQKIAQSQLEIVYNLVAQRDNKDNLKMAKISTEIASVTKDDSFAMRTIAVMSIVFLPGTFISSFFSMGMFDWQAPSGDSVLSSRFWVYWAVTIPLTLAVLSIWLVWLHSHEDRDTTSRRAQRERKHMFANRHPISLVKRLVRPGTLPWNRRNMVENNEIHEEAVAETVNLQDFTGSEAMPAVPKRSNTLVQGPRR
ncbi:MAG: hypothetical protein Q9191_005976 [Dirinaria sp. TL-2023a]